MNFTFRYISTYYLYMCASGNVRNFEMRKWDVRKKFVRKFFVRKWVQIFNSSHSPTMILLSCFDSFLNLTYLTYSICDRTSFYTKGGWVLEFGNRFFNFVSALFPGSATWKANNELITFCFVQREIKIILYSSYECELIGVINLLITWISTSSTPLEIVPSIIHLSCKSFPRISNSGEQCSGT